MFEIARRSVAVVPRVPFAIALTNLGVLARDIERLGQFARGEHAQRLASESVLAVELAAGVHLAADAIHAGKQTAAVTQPISSDATEREVGLALAVGAKCGVRRTEKSRMAR